jgi:rod shape determining protein RodA
MTSTLPRPEIALVSYQAARRARSPLTRRRRRTADWVLNIAALILALLGALLVWSATRDGQLDHGHDPEAYFYRHLVNIGIGLALYAIAARLDARQLRLFGPIVYAAGCLGLVAVFFIGTTINGAHAWIRLAGFEIQPAEFAKLGLIVGLAVMFGQRAIGRPLNAKPRSADVLIALGLCAVPLALIMLQPDLGSAMVLAAAAFGVLIAAGVDARWTIGLLIAAIALGWLVVRMGMLADYQLARFKAFADPHADPQGVAYNVTQARIAIAHGGLFGQGLFHGTQTSGGFVPEQQTDFIFSVAGEELGFAGAAGLIGLYALVLWRAIRIAKAADRIGRLVAIGIVCWFAFQVFQNIGMNLGMTPVTGLPLPFVSYGGSSMFAGALAIGLLQAVRRAARAD